MRARLLALLVVVAVAGCTSPLGDGGGDGDSGPTIEGVKVVQAELEDSTLSRDRETRLVLRVENTNPVPVRNFTASLSNTGPLSVELGSGPCGPEGSTLSAAAGSAITRTCVWNISTYGVSGTQVGTYPVQLRLAYNATVTMVQNTPKFTFVSDVEDRSETTQSYSNGELEMTVRHVSEQSTGAANVETDIAVEDVGGGDVIPGGDGTDVRLRYGGSMMDSFRFWGGDVSEDLGTRRCRNINFIGGSSSGSTTCVLYPSGSASFSEGETLNLRVAAGYTYRRFLELPITVEE